MIDWRHFFRLIKQWEWILWWTWKIFSTYLKTFSTYYRGKIPAHCDYQKDLKIFSTYYRGKIPAQCDYQKDHWWGIFYNGKEVQKYKVKASILKHLIYNACHPYPLSKTLKSPPISFEMIFIFSTIRNVCGQGNLTYHDALTLNIGQVKCWCFFALKLFGQPSILGGRVNFVSHHTPSRCQLTLRAIFKR